jgi:hypothetical protein
MEQALEKSRQLSDIGEFITYANSDKTAEFEAKILAGRIQTRDVAERLLKAIRSLSSDEPVRETRLTYTLDDSTRVHVVGAVNVHHVCMSESFAGVPVDVERKLRYFESIDRTTETKTAGRDTIDISDFFCRFTLKTEKHLRKDYSGPVNDPKASIRVLDRQSFSVPGNEFRIDFSMVKSKASQKEGLRKVLKNTPTYELEIEYTPRKEPRPFQEVRRTMFRVIESILGAYQETHHILPLSDLQRYVQEFKVSGNTFYQPVTLERRHIVPDRAGNILKGYTVTNKADGERCGLYVTRDKRMIRVTPNGQVTFTGFTAIDDAHVEDFLDGEYLADKNLFCIFDIYKYRGRTTKGLPLFTTDDDIRRNPLASRLGCARKFVMEIGTTFATMPGDVMRIETKTFLAGDNGAMEESIAKILTMDFEYKTDGLVFTPRDSPVAPPADTKGRTWRSVYKWKPPHQNSIDFLVRFEPESSYDVNMKSMVRKGTLYVSRTPGEDIVYPCETMTGEYIPPKLPRDMASLAQDSSRAPSVFQPSAPRNVDAYKINIPVNDRDIPVDLEGLKVEDNTIIECAYDVPKGTWSVMRTRYDKTYEYRVMHRPQFGNDIYVADNIWTSIHTPIPEEMLKTLYTTPVDDTLEDDMYYRDENSTSSRNRSMVRSFHNQIKSNQYSKYVFPGNTLIEIAVGRGGDMHKWRHTKPSKVLGIDLSLSNLVMPRQGACTRYLIAKRSSSEYLPRALFAQGDMTKLFEEQDSKYLNIVFGDEPATTPYLGEFRNIQRWEVASCQFAIHYACETEEAFKVFAQNLRHCRGTFFGTCLDGKAVYSLLVGKDRHAFRNNGRQFAEMTKGYTDEGAWKEEFGQKIDVLLDSMVKPATEFLVPFARVQEILADEGFELTESQSFADIYTGQTSITLDRSEQDFSFLYRTFAFRRVTNPIVKEVAAAEPASDDLVEEVPAAEPVAEPAAAAPPAEKKAPVRRKKIKAPSVAGEELAPPPPPEILYFFSKEPENKEFSNFYETNFTLDGVEYKSAEHAFQAIKAKTFGDDVNFGKILKAKSAQSAKSFGKKVVGFKEDVWTPEKKEDIMKQIVRAKFTQNLELRKKLLDSGDKILANADARDKFWGVGTSATTAIAKDPSKWKGENKLGKMLVELRTELRAEVA